MTYELRLERLFDAPPEAVWTAGVRGGVPPRCARARPAPIPIVSKARLVAAPMVAIGFVIPTRESLPHAPPFGERWSSAPSLPDARQPRPRNT